MRTLTSIVLVAGWFVLSGCATVTGAATGALTGAVDAPAEVYRAKRAEFENYPILHGPNALIFSLVGVATGPLFGLAKGASLDIPSAIGQVEYAEVFGSYRPVSIWRPHTIRWPSKTQTAARKKD